MTKRYITYDRSNTPVVLDRIKSLLDADTVDRVSVEIESGFSRHNDGIMVFCKPEDKYTITIKINGGA